MKFFSSRRAGPIVVVAYRWHSQFGTSSHAGLLPGNKTCSVSHPPIAGGTYEVMVRLVGVGEQCEALYTIQECSGRGVTRKKKALGNGIYSRAPARRAVCLAKTKNTTRNLFLVVSHHHRIYACFTRWHLLFLLEVRPTPMTTPLTLTANP